MPRLTDATKRLRRLQIADAAMRCFAREGFRDTTMADIIAESGLSAGSIYSHFPNKANLLRMVAAEVLETRLRGVVDAAAAASAPMTPGTLFERIVATVFEPDRSHVLLQVWAEAPVDPELAQVAHEKMQQVRAFVRDTLQPWMQATAEPSAQRADALADAFVTCVQGYAVRRTLDPSLDGAALARSLGALLDRG